MKDLTGQKFNKWTVIKFSKYDPKERLYLWKCICDCGTIRLVPSKRLFKNRSKSCGCLTKEVQKNRLLTHGKWGTLTYKTWDSMIQRCTNPKNPKYSIYGGKGIKVCNRWLNSFENFFKDMGERPNITYSIDRIDSNKNYESSNCRWILKSENSKRVHDV